MAKVKPKLYLNMSPQTQEEGSLAFARNMKIDDDGSLVSDYGYKNISALSAYNIVGHVVGLDNKIYFFCHTLINGAYVDKIVEYDEATETATALSTNWTYDGGEIDGHVSTNISGEKILTIAEYKASGSVPLKHINLSFATVGDESFYSQAPKCPTANLVLTGTYVKTIPNGVYVFFIRYKLRKDVYTNWFMCSRPIFGGTSEKITTLQGGLSYINLHKDSAKSFVFNLNFAQKANIGSYSEFQLGFIISHDEATDARTWKHFNMSSFSTNGGSIYFDYEDVAEANIDDLLETTYELYNVRNVTAFKNKLYISNYLETNFNPSDVDGVKQYVKLELAHSNSSEVSYKNMKYNNTSLHYDYTKGYYDKTSGNASLKTLVSDKTHFNFDVTKLSKVDTKEKTDVVRFDVFWKGETDPDVALVYNIYNDLHNKVIFGSDDFTPVPDNYGDETKINRVGLHLVDWGSNAYIYAPRVNGISALNHPWFNLGFSFGFGSYKASEIGTPNYKLGCSVFNAYTFNYESSYIAGHDSSKLGWFSRDSGFADFARSTIESTIQREIEGRSFFAKCYLEVASGANTYLIDYKEAMDLDNYAGNNMSFEVYIPNTSYPHSDYREASWKYYSDTDLTILDPSLFSTTAMSNSLKDKITDWVFGTVYNRLVGIDESGVPVINVGTNQDPVIVKANSISVRFKKFDFTLDNEDIDTTDGHYVKRFKVSLKTTDYVSLCTFSIKNSYITVTDNGIGAEQKSTLMPFSKYQPYLHLVDDHNIITNGAKLDAITTGAATTNADVLYLKYKVTNSFNSTTYSRWKSFFISLVNVGDIVMEGFNYQKDPNSPTTNILHCLEIDAMLYNINDNITIKDASGTVITSAARYYSSGSVYPPLAFGNCGFISWEGQSNDDYSNSKLYIIISRNKESENVNELVKASSYIPLHIQDPALELPDGYYGSWLCLVKKPDFILSSSCYVSGRDVYAVNRASALSLSEFKSFIQVQSSITYFVRSNFNLNYLSLTQDINDSIFTVGSASSGVKQVAKVIDSAILSYIYELKAMYKDFANKYFRHTEDNAKIDFDNTVRVSQVLSDETFNNSIFKFGAEDYYNVPTDRGIIVNLFAIGNNIFVHTKTSFYKFDGNQTISASNGDVTLQESEPFANGVTQIFDSEYGYGGIHNKEAGCVTFDSYVFYDAMSNHIFAYSGNGQVQLIDASIYKILTFYKPDICRTLHDDANHRVLFEFKSTRAANNVGGADNLYHTFCISYNYKAKSFVSVHDITLEKAFSSRYLAYSYKGTPCMLFNTVNGISQTVLNAELNVLKLFGDASSACIVQFGGGANLKQSTPFSVAVIMYPLESELETLNSVTVDASVVQNPIITTPMGQLYDVIDIKQKGRTNPFNQMFVITDRCVSTIVTGAVDDTARPESLKADPSIPNALLDYKGFKFDRGFWNSNYFRNALDTNDIYGYPNQPREGQTPNSDNFSLVYGRYFIVNINFITANAVKIESIFVNANKY